jgi:hypothetical protein
LSSPCKNGGTCSSSGATFSCNCPAGTSGPRCIDPVQSYYINITVDDLLFDIYLDGVKYDTVYDGSWDLKDTVNADFLPKVVAVYGRDTGAMFGVIASDSAGYVTDDGWKCTKDVYADWMLPDYDDSVWPTALVEEMNGVRDSQLNTLWHGKLPIKDVSNRAYWIWAQDYNSTIQYNYAHCRRRIPAAGNTCFSSPCKNGGTCTNNGATFSCSCASGFSGPQCTQPSFAYQLNITGDNEILDLYLDGIKYDVPNSYAYLLSGTVNANFKPKVIAVYVRNDYEMYGILASDNNGLVTGSGWKCTKDAYTDWMLVSYDDSAWPAALVEERNGNLTSTFNTRYHGQLPISGISPDAYWIWSRQPESAGNLVYVYCRSPPLY